VTVSQKVALSLLISVFLFAGFTVLAFTGLFDLVETRFYNPSIIKGLTEDVNRDTETIQEFLAELQRRFSATLQETPVKSSFLPNQTAEDIFERTRIYGLLLESLGGLQGVRFIDAGGSKIHYSTYAQDILRQDRFSLAYRDYRDSPENLPYGQIEALNGGNMKITFDNPGGRIVFSFPFYDSLDVYRGTALFALSLRGVTEQLIREGRIKAGESLSLLGDPMGLVTGIPYSLENVLLPAIASLWEEGSLSLSPLDSAGSGISLVLFSSKTPQGIFVGRLVDESVFSFPLPLKVILLSSFFLTVYLIIFLVFNAKQDVMTVLENRLRQLRLSFIEQYYDRKSGMDLDQWNRELEQRHEEIRAELKRGLGIRGEDNKEIDGLIDNFWDELLAITGDRRDMKAAAGGDEQKLRAILNRILQASSGASPGASPGLLASDDGEMPAAEQDFRDLGGLDIPEGWEFEPANLEKLQALGEFGDLDESEPGEMLMDEDEPEELEEIESVEDPDRSGMAPVAEILTERPGGTEGSINAEEISAAEAIIAKNPQRKHSNIRLAFGDDDIPYIVESSGLELADDEFDSEPVPPPHAEEALAAGADDAEEPEELEELEELEEAEEVEELDTAEDVLPLTEGPSAPGQDIDELAREIEFSPTPEPEENLSEANEDLEIVSPFADIFFDFSNTDTEEADQEDFAGGGGDSPPKKGPQAKLKEGRDPSGDSADLEEMGNKFTMSLVYRSFFQGKTPAPDFLEAPLSEPAGEDPVIEERDGLHFVSQAVLAPEKVEENLDREFKNLVDSLLR
jgi:hypothetical protein